MDNYLTKLSKIEILLTNIGHGQNFDKPWTETGQNLYICQKIVQILSNPPFYRSTEKYSQKHCTAYFSAPSMFISTELKKANIERPLLYQQITTFIVKGRGFPAMLT